MYMHPACQPCGRWVCVGGWEGGRAWYFSGRELGLYHRITVPARLVARGAVGRVSLRACGVRTWVGVGAVRQRVSEGEGTALVGHLIGGQGFLRPSHSPSSEDVHMGEDGPSRSRAGSVAIVTGLEPVRYVRKSCRPWSGELWGRLMREDMSPSLAGGGGFAAKTLVAERRFMVSVGVRELVVKRLSVEAYGS